MITAQDPTFGELVRRYRRDRGLTQEELAERATLSVRAISDLERGLKYRPRKDTVQLLADALELRGIDRDSFQRAARQAGALQLVAAEGEVLGELRSVEQVSATPPTNLPDEPTPFVGREDEITALVALLQQPKVRLVTLTGPGGSGKTRLALEVASSRLPSYQDGVFLVSLAPLTDPDLVAPSIAATLEITDSGEHSLLEELQRSLQDKHLLLVLDNFEHLPGAAPLVGDLAGSCPSLQLLVTSREILHLSAEHEFLVPPLSLPDLHQAPDAKTLSQYDAVAFFVDRAQAVRPGFVLTGDIAGSIAAICHRLDGLPLALELAAARIRLFPPQALLGRLSHSLDLLTGGARDRPTRQKTLRATMDWSYSLLRPEEQVLFARLSVFAEGCTLEAVEAVCNPEGNLPLTVVDGVTSLVEKNLVRQEAGLGDEPRFGMLETIREYAAVKLDARKETQEIRQHHAHYFLDFAEAIRPQLDGPGQIEGLDRLEEEHSNLRAAVDWACEQGEVEVGLRLAIAAEYLYMRGGSIEVAGWFERLLALQSSQSNPVHSSLRAEALQLGAAYTSWVQGNGVRGRALTEELIALIDELQDPREIAYRLQGAGDLLSAQGEHGRAMPVLEQALSMFRQLDEKAGMGVVLVNLGDIARAQGDALRMIELCEESLHLSRKAGNSPRVVNALHTLGVAARMQGDLDRARTLCGEALQLNRQIGMEWDRAELLASLAAIVREQGDLDEAEALLAEAVSLGVTFTGEIELTATSLEGMAGVMADRGRAEHAAALFGAAYALRERIGRSVRLIHRPVYNRDLASVKAALGDERFTSRWEEGRAVTVERAIAYALTKARE